MVPEVGRWEAPVDRQKVSGLVVRRWVILQLLSLYGSGVARIKAPAGRFMGAGLQRASSNLSVCTPAV